MSIGSKVAKGEEVTAAGVVLDVAVGQAGGRIAGKLARGNADKSLEKKKLWEEALGTPFTFLHSNSFDSDTNSRGTRMKFNSINRRMQMKVTSMKWAMLLIVTLLTASCGGGGGSTPSVNNAATTTNNTATTTTSNTTTSTSPTTSTYTTTTPTIGPVPDGTMTITVVSPTAGTTTKTYTGTYYTLDPTLIAMSVASIDFNRSSFTMNSSSSVQLLLIAGGVTPGTYTGTGIDSSATSMRYIIFDSPTNPTTYVCTDGTIVVTAVGGTGSPWTGTYQGTFRKAAPVLDLTNTLQLSGNFNIY